MSKSNKTSTYFKSYCLEHKANPSKVDSLFDFYSIYKSEYKIHISNYWNLFLNNNIKNNKFSHLGSTKHINTKLNASYLQVCLSQACAVLNNYLSNIEEKFKQFINRSTIKDKDLLHKLRTINSKHAWINKNVLYYPEVIRYITDDFGNTIIIKSRQETWIDKFTLKLARKIFNNIISKQRVRFPNLDKPRLIIDSRLYELEQSKTNSFDYWIKVSTHIPRQRISIPIRKNTFFELANGHLGKTIELNFNHYNYQIIQHKHDSLSKPKRKNKGLAKVNKTIDFIFNKKHDLEELFKDKTYNNEEKNRNISFDLGLCNFIAISDGKLYGQYWLEKLTQYDKRIADLSSVRQSLGLKTRSKRYNGLINQVRGFIKTETNKILNHYFDKNQDIKTITIEKLKFNSPSLSKRLNRIIQNFGYKLFKDKLEKLSLFYGFTIEEFNPAYTSQECSECHYVDENNRQSQDKFICKCCKTELNADINGSRTNLKRFENKQSSIYKAVYKSVILRKLKLDFVSNIKALISNGIVGRRYLYNLLVQNKYFKQDIKNIVRTTEASGVKPMTALNFDKYLFEYYSTI